MVRPSWWHLVQAAWVGRLLSSTLVLVVTVEWQSTHLGTIFR